MGDSCSEDGSCVSALGCGFMCLMADTELETCLYDYCAPSSQQYPDGFFSIVFCVAENCGQPSDPSCVESELSMDSACGKYLSDCVSPAMD